MNLTAARVFVRDIDEAIAFYSGPLGLKIEAVDAERGFCMFDTGATRLIVEVTDAQHDESQALVGRFTGLSFAVEDIQSRHRELLSAGVEFSGAPEQQSWGGWLATFKDPSGNGLQLVQQPG